MTQTRHPTGKPITGLRPWLEHLSDNDRLAVMRPGVNLKFELAGISNRLDGARAALFPAPEGHAMSVVSGLLSNRQWIADAMGVAPAQVLSRFGAAMQKPLPWREIENAPVQAQVHRNVDLCKLLPIPTYNELDSGPYITAGLLIARNPQTGVQNVSIHRLQVSGPAELGAYLLPRHTLAYQRMAEDSGEDLPVAIVIGADPLTLLASQAIAPLDQDELTIAGALHGAPLSVVKCLTSDVRVPAHAEIVIEGHLIANKRAPEGPFGEFPQYYGAREDHHVIAVDAITHSRDPIFHSIVGGSLEHLMLGAIPREATILESLRRNFPGITDLHLARGGVCRYHLHVQMKKRSEGEAKNVIFGAFAAHYDVKQVIVVDEDVNIHDTAEVEWAVSTRFQADRDLIIAANSLGSRLDPSTRDGVGAKMGLDATKPLDAPEMRYLRIRVPGQDEIDLTRAIASNSWRAAG